MINFFNIVLYLAAAALFVQSWPYLTGERTDYQYSEEM